MGLCVSAILIRNFTIIQVKPLILFPIIYIAISVINLIYRIDDAVHPNELPRYSLGILNAVLMPSCGKHIFIISRLTVKKTFWERSIENIRKIAFFPLSFYH